MVFPDNILHLSDVFCKLFFANAKFYKYTVFKYIGAMKTGENFWPCKSVSEKPRTQVVLVHDIPVDCMPHVSYDSITELGSSFAALLHLLH